MSSDNLPCSSCQGNQDCLLFLPRNPRKTFHFSASISISRVDVSETFSADQLWFRILSGLFQRCSLPENLWTALIQLWTALKTEFFRAENQCWNGAVQLWHRADSDFLWDSSETGNFQSKKISAESELFRAVFLWFSAVQRWSKFVTFWSEIVKIH